jgi:hypothetical protein
LSRHFDLIAREMQMHGQSDELGVAGLEDLGDVGQGSLGAPVGWSK